MSQPRLVLASGSPRRRELLEAAGYRPEVVPARDGVEEAGACSGCGPAELVVELARVKLTDVLEQLGAPAERTVVLAADTVAECHGQILGKPRDEEHAAAMMAALSGREHRVYTGVALAVTPDDLGRGPRVAEAVVTTLRMDELSPEWIADYAESGAWEGKAGGFGYQDGLGFVHVTEGSESNVVGLPMERVAEWLGEAGINNTIGSDATLPSSSTFRVAKQIGQWAAFAQVALTVVERGDDAPLVSVVNEKQLDSAGRYLSGLTYGAAYAFQEITQSTSLSILVTNLHTNPVDSTSQSIAYATCFAIWNAMGHTSSIPPFLDEESKTFVFPSE